MCSIIITTAFLFWTSISFWFTCFQYWYILCWINNCCYIKWPEFHLSHMYSLICIALLYQSHGCYWHKFNTYHSLVDVINTPKYNFLQIPPVPHWMVPLSHGYSRPHWEAGEGAYYYYLTSSVPHSNQRKILMAYFCVGFCDFLIPPTAIHPPLLCDIQIHSTPIWHNTHQSTQICSTTLLLCFCQL